MCLLTHERYKTYQTGDLGMGLKGQLPLDFFASVRICDGAPSNVFLGPWYGVKGSITIRFLRELGDLRWHAIECVLVFLFQLLRKNKMAAIFT